MATDLDKKIETARQQGYSDAEINQYLQAKGVFAPSLNPVWQPGEGTNKVADFLGSSALGRRLGGNIYAGTQSSQKLDTAIQGQKDTLTRLEAQIAKNRAIGKDTARLESARTQLMKDIGMSDYTQQQLQSGGVTGKQALGSALQTAAFALPATRVASKALGATKVGQSLAGLEAAAQFKPFQYGLTEGALSGSLFGAGRGLETDKSVLGSALGYGVGGGVAGGILNPILQPLIGGALKSIMPKAVKPFERVAQEASTQLQKNALDEFNSALGFGNMKKASQIITELGDASKLAESPRYSAMEGLWNRSANDGITVFNKKRQPVAFNPEKATASEFYQAVINAKDQVSNQMGEVLSSVGDEGFSAYKNKAVQTLRQIQAEPRYGSEARNAIQKHISHIEDNINNPKDLYDYMTTTISKEVDSFFSSPDVSKAVDTAPRVKKVLNDAIDEYLGQFDASGSLKQLRLEYGSYKSIENELETIFRKEFSNNPEIINHLDTYGLSNIISGSVFANPAQSGKGLAFTMLKLADSLTGKTTTKELQSAFRNLGRYYSINEIERGVINPNLDEIFKSYQAQTNKSIVPVGEVKTGPLGTIPVAPAGEGNRFDFLRRGITPSASENKNAVQEFMNLVPEAQKQEVQKAMDTIKKTLDDLGQNGSAQLGLLLSGALATGAVATGNIPGKKETYENLASAKTAFASEIGIGNMPLDELKQQVAHRETGIVKGDPYKHVNKSDSEFGDALGKYQVRELTLKEWSKRILGKQVTPKEFLANPDLQEKFFEGVINRFSTEYEITDPEQAMVLWHKGWSPKNINMSPEQLKLSAKDYLNNKI